MPNPLRYTLLSDGSSDKRLMPIIDWLIEQHNLVPNGEWADLRWLRNPPTQLSDRIIKAVELYQCEILFIHRDAEAIPFHQRRTEITLCVNTARGNGFLSRYTAVVPVRMHEAWLLINTNAIKSAAGNPSGLPVLNLPRLNQLEMIPDPKHMLEDLLLRASELKGRRLKNFNINQAAYLVAQRIQDYSPLRTLPAFQQFEEDFLNALQSG